MTVLLIIGYAIVALVVAGIITRYLLDIENDDAGNGFLGIVGGLCWPLPVTIFIVFQLSKGFSRLVRKIDNK